MQSQKYNTYNQKALQAESPQVFRDRPMPSGADIQHISPIPPLSNGSSDYNSQHANDKAQSRLQFVNSQALYQNIGNAGMTKQLNDGDTPNTLAKEFYKRPQPQLDVRESNDFYFESYEDSTEGGGPQAIIKRANPSEISSGLKYTPFENQYLHSTNSNQIKSINSKGMPRGEQCTDFDLTAKEISTNKRFSDKINNNKKTILSGRTSHSPMDGAPSNSETVKWAFSNKDSQETQKKISIINRESINTQDIISRSLKSHDSRTVLQQQTSASHQAVHTGALKGKMLDFANLDPSSQQLESALFYSSNKAPHIITSNSSDISLIDEREEQKVVSFLENDDEDEMMIQSTITNNVRSQNATAKAYKKQSARHASKYLVGRLPKNGEALHSMIENTIECPFCNQQKVYDSSLQCSKIEGPKSSSEIIKENLEKKYLTSREYYNVKIINDIIYNECTHIVSVFKDYLIFDDISEFLKRFYNKLEGVQRLPKMFEFYEKYSKVFPNYVNLPENKYLFKNIEKKQRIIDEKQRFLMDQQEKKNQPQEFQLGTSADKKNRHRDRFSSQQQNSSNVSYMSNNKMFDTNFINSVANIQASGIIESMMSSRINNSQFQEHVLNSSVLIQQQLHENMENAKKKKQKKFLEDMDFDELISKFIAKDSESNIQQSTILFHTEENRPKAEEPAQKPKRVYDYQEKKVLQPSVAQSDNSKSDNASSLRPTSAKQQDKRLSSGSQKAPNNSDQSKKEQTKEKILNYNIYNNYNQFINNENYYISADKKEEQIQAQGGSRAGSLQRNQSKNNLHQGQIVAKPQECKTPAKGAAKREVITPGSGETRQEKRDAVVQRAHKLAQEQALKLQEEGMLSNRTSNSLQRSDNLLSSSPLNSYGTRTNFLTGTINTCRANTEAIVSRELSKEKKPQQQQLQNPKQWQNANTQMFKNEFIANIAAGRFSDQHQPKANQDYNLPTQVRSVEKLKCIEDEITNDYSKYVNEYGLTKTAFAKAVNSIRDKKLKIQNPTQQNIQSQPSTTRQTRLSTNSNEKRMSSNNGRQNSTSQSRKCSNSRQTQKPTVLAQETANDLYMNINSVRSGQDKQIRSVRAKTHLSSNNSSSCFQRSQKLSPDKNTFMITHQFNGQPGFNQSLANQTSQQNFITLKSNQRKQAKGIKIKFPLNKENQVQANTSSNQTPKRIKLQKTKSTSNIPLCFSQRVQQPTNMIATSRGRSGAPDMMIMDELSQQLTNNTMSIRNIEQTQNMDNQILQSIMFPQSAYQSSSCVGTYATTSILNSPLSFKQQAYQPVQQVKRQDSKGRQSSRNGNQSQHQSQKSISGNHQRASSTLGGSNPNLQGSNSKQKKVEPKRLSAGSNQSKRAQHHQAHHQPSQSNINQQILQLLMTYQNEGDMTNVSSQQQYQMPFQSSLKSLQNGGQSMKDLKQVKQPTAMLKDLQMVKAPKVKLATTQGGQGIHQMGLNTQRQGQTGSIIMLNQNFKKSGSKTGKSTQRNDSKKRIQQHNNPYENPSIYNSNMQMTNTELSSRLALALGSDQTSMASQAEAKTILSYSKSQDNFDLIKLAAQRAALEQQQQQLLQSQFSQQQLPISNLQATSKFIQNLKPSTDNPISLQKIKFVQQPQQMMQPIQSARNLQYEYKVNNADYDSYNKGPTNIIIGNNFDKPSSRRTSGKFNPSSTKSQQQ